MVVSSQICVAVRHAIRNAGLVPVYVDIDESFPTPSPQQLAAAIDSNTAAIIVAPFYGYIQSDWGALTEACRDIPICVDMAQGLLLEERMAPLIDHAAALLYSFSIGKGLDIGGSVLFTLQPLATGADRRGAVRAGTILNGLLLRTLVRFGLYRLIVPLIEQAVEDDHDPGTLRGSFASRDVAGHRPIWAARAAAYAAEVQHSRDAAGRIFGNAVVKRACRDREVYGDPGATHLRQVIRLQDAARRDAVIEALHQHGIDCAPAGEPLPSGDDERAFPNAVRFNADAIRLPFLGRLTDGERAQVEHAIEAALG